jgi:hypothetical protein
MSKTPSEYAKKLRDPRWQKKRLEIFTRDEWRCQQCSDTEATLHVHHRQYVFGKDPWDYSSDWLVTLCEHCHEAETHDRKEAERNLLSFLRLEALSTASDVQELYNTLYLRTFGNGYSFSVSLSAIDYVLRSQDFMAEYFKFLEQRRIEKASGGAA